MVSVISKKISTFILNRVDADDILKEKFDYSVKYILNQIVYYLSLLCVLGLANMIDKKVAICGLVYLFFFHLNRKYFGGFHLKSHQACFIMSMIVPVVCGILGAFLTQYNVYFFLIYIPYIYVVIKLGVVDHPNKRLPKKWKDRLFKRGMILIGCTFLIQVVGYKYQFIFIPGFISVAVTILSLTGGRYYNERQQ